MGKQRRRKRRRQIIAKVAAARTTTTTTVGVQCKPLLACLFNITKIIDKLAFHYYYHPHHPASRSPLLFHQLFRNYRLALGFLVWPKTSRCAVAKGRRGAVRLVVQIPLALLQKLPPAKMSELTVAISIATRPPLLLPSHLKKP